jgi:hypothetical protein
MGFNLQPDAAGPLALFVLFALLATVGAYLVAAQYRGRTTAIVAAALTLLFFAGLGAAVISLLREAP